MNAREPAPRPETERRRAPRAVAEQPIHLRSDRDSCPALLRNISTHGICCEVDRPVAEMTRMGVELELPQAADLGRIEGVVVRCEQSRWTAGRYEVAIFFPSPPADVVGAIAAYVRARATR